MDAESLGASITCPASLARTPHSWAWGSPSGEALLHRARKSPMRRSPNPAKPLGMCHDCPQGRPAVGSPVTEGQRSVISDGHTAHGDASQVLAKHLPPSPATARPPQNASDSPGCDRCCLHTVRHPQGPQIGLTVGRSTQFPKLRVL